MFEKENFNHVPTEYEIKEYINLEDNDKKYEDIKKIIQFRANK